MVNKSKNAGLLITTFIVFAMLVTPVLAVEITDTSGGNFFVNSTEYGVSVGNNTSFTSFGSIRQYFSNNYNASDNVANGFLANYINLRRSTGGGAVDIIPNLIASPDSSIEENGTFRTYLRYNWNSDEAVIHWYFYDDYYVGRFTSAITTTVFDDGIEVFQVINDDDATGGLDRDGLDFAIGTKASDNTTTPSTSTNPDLFDQTSDYWVAWFGVEDNDFAMGRIGQAMPSGATNIFSDLTDVETTGSDYFDQLWQLVGNLTSYDDMFTITVLYNGSSEQQVEFLFNLYENPATVTNFDNSINLAYNTKSFIYEVGRSNTSVNAIINVTGNSAWNGTTEQIYFIVDNITSDSSVWQSTDNVSWGLLYNNNMQFDSGYTIFSIDASKSGSMLYSIGNVTPAGGVDNDMDGFDSIATGGTDCNDNNATERPILNDSQTLLNTSITICTGTYSNATITFNANDLTINGNGSTINNINPNDVRDIINGTTLDGEIIRNFALLLSNTSVVGGTDRIIDITDSTNILIQNNSFESNHSDHINGYGDNWLILDNTFTHTLLNSINGGSSIRNSQFTNAGDNWNISNNEMIGGYIQVYISSADASTNEAENWDINNNNLSLSRDEALFLHGLTNATIHHNNMFNGSPTGPGCFGIPCYRGIYMEITANNDIYNNSVTNAPLGYLSTGDDDRWHNNTANNVTFGFYLGDSTDSNIISDNTFDTVLNGFHTALQGGLFYPNAVTNNLITQNTITNTSENGIFFRTHITGLNGNNSFIDNIISHTGATTGYGIYFNQNGTNSAIEDFITLNRITDFDNGIFVTTDSPQIQIIDNNVITSITGLQVNGVDGATINLNQLNSSGNELDTFFLTNSTITNMEMTDIFLQNSSSNNLSNLNITVRLEYEFSNNNIMLNSEHILSVFDRSTGNLHANGTHTGGTSSVTIDDTGTNTFLNITGSEDSGIVRVRNCGGIPFSCPAFNNQWYGSGNVTNATGSPLSGANVSFTSTLGSLANWGLTDANGTTDLLPITQYTSFFGSIQPSPNPYTVDATLIGFSTLPQTATINVSDVYNFTMGVDADGDGFDVDIDCVDTNATIIPLLNNTTNTITESKLICTDTYINPTVILGADNISVDGNESILIGDTTGNGIEITNQINTNVSKFTILTYEINIFLNGTNQSTITNNTIINATATGGGGGGGAGWKGAISLTNTQFNTISNNNVLDSDNVGISLGTSSGAGALGGASNNTISGNTVTNSAEANIRLNPFSGWNTISGNTVAISSNWVDIKIGSDNNIISGNVLTGSSGILGLYISDDFGGGFVQDNQIIGNTFTNYNGSQAMYLWQNNNATVTNNLFTLNAYESVAYFDTTTNSLINNNRFLNNSITAILIDNSDDNTITGNNISGNAVSGLNITSSSSDDNLVYNNLFIDNGINAVDPVLLSSNDWNLPSIQIGTNIIGGARLGGNFWSDYNGSDTSFPPDGIGDTDVPFDSSGGIAVLFGGDAFPLTNTTGGTGANTATVLSMIPLLLTGLFIILFVVKFILEGGQLDVIELLKFVMIGAIVIVIVWALVQGVITI